MATHTDTTTVIADTIAGLKAAWDVSKAKYPWIAGITATDVSPYLKLEADVAGVLFIVTLNDPGAAATFTLTTPTPSAGPNHVDDDTNWSLGHKPTTSEEIVVADTSVDLLWGLDQLAAVEISSFVQKKTHAGKIGLDYATFNGNGNAKEYRPCYLQLLFKTGDEQRCELGQHFGAGNPSGSRRTMIDVQDQACTVTIHSTASTSFETGRPACRLLCDCVGTAIEVRGAPAGFGVACDKPGETSKFEEMSISVPSQAHRVFVSEGCDWVLIEQTDGYSVVSCSVATAESLIVDGGVVQTEGDWQLGGLSVYDGGKVFQNHVYSGGGACIGDVNLNAGGVIDTRMSNAERTWLLLNWEHSPDGSKAGLLLWNEALTLTEINLNSGVGTRGG